MHTTPTVFVSHGAPSFAIEPGRAGRALNALAETLPRPAAVLMVSPHWMTHDVQVSTSPKPHTLDDFAGFEPELHTLTYPSPGHPELAQRAIDALRDAGWAAQANPRRGLDHGAWVPLRHLYPEADIPVFQVSMPASLDARRAWNLGAALAPLRQAGVLIIGSGSLTHNLYEFDGGPAAPEPYVVEFANWIADAVGRGDTAQLLNALVEAPHARRAHPSAEHFLPLLVAAGAASGQRVDEQGHVDAGGLTGRRIDGDVLYGMLSMDGFVFQHRQPMAPGHSPSS